MRYCALLSLTLFLLLTSCGNPLPELKDVDLTAWKADKNGCSGKRQESIEALRSQLTLLQGLSEMEVIAMLGKPDQNELYKRNQKFYYYFLEAGPACINPVEKPLRLSVRFNAVGLAKEVLVERMLVSG